MPVTLWKRLPSAVERSPRPGRPALITGAEFCLAGASVLALCGVALLSQQIHSPPAVRGVAQFMHLACVVVGLGSVLAVDWFGLRWRLGHITLPAVVAVAGTLAVPIWLGLGGLLLSGMFLEPDLTSPSVRLKIVMVAATGVAGTLALAISRRLSIPGRTPSRRLLRAAAAVVAMSQIAWWGAAVIGFLNRS